MKCVIYIRVSTEEQAQEGYSIKAQLSRLEAYAISQGWTIVKTYIDDGQSAKDMNRTDLKKMLNDLEKNEYECVLVYRLDRLTRSVLDLYTMLDIFEKHNVKFKSATEVYDTTTAMGRLFITLVAALAQWERENTGERVRMGMTQKAKEGKWVINVAPYGFDIDGDFLKINELEAAVVKEIFNLYLTGKYGVGKIAKMLNQKGYLTKAGANWQDGPVRYILTNKIYIGTMRYNYRVNKEQYFEIENAVLPLIEKEKFYEVQSILNNRSTLHPRKATSPYIFTSVLRCSRCGGAMAGRQATSKRNGKKYISYSYYCHNQKFGTCDLPHIAQNYLEIQFLNKIKEWNMSYELGNDIVNNAESKPDVTKRIKVINNELKALESRRSKWQYAWVNNMLSDNDLRKRTEEEDTKEKTLLRELDKLNQNEQIDSKREMLAEALLDLQKNWNKLDVYEKKKFVLLVVKELSVNKAFKKMVPESVEITNIDFL
ncbi:recombinase family protein [Niallia sp. 03091]|uniref:recombinase family protein n=1 Tax=Niallia sp. 03091 TaxID=3458059 RepID=UPI004044CBA8